MVAIVLYNENMYVCMCMYMSEGNRGLSGMGVMMVWSCLRDRKPLAVDVACSLVLKRAVSLLYHFNYDVIAATAVFKYANVRERGRMIPRHPLVTVSFTCYSSIGLRASEKYLWMRLSFNAYSTLVRMSWFRHAH